ncbi:MAG: ThiF family adenylyltransferase [Verrucomicrobia bacterium]|nr:ThiF family adenylyltransferase [Verrucomicrobiota bacterium]
MTDRDSGIGRPGKHVVLVGLGNIGSPLVGLLARSAWVGRLTLIDGDSYEEANVRGQAIAAGDVGKPKVSVQAARVRRIAPGMGLEAIAALAENVPMGRLRGDLIVAAVDSKAARQGINQIAWRLGIPWVDAGVAAEGLLARTRAFVPASDGPCLECGWDQRDYDTLTVNRSCAGRAGEPGGTRAPAYLGSLAASMQAHLCQQLLTEGSPAELGTREWMMDLTSHQLHETAYRRNPRCRFDHRTWQVRTLSWGPAGVSVAEAFGRLGRLMGAGEGLTLHLAGRPLVKRLRCACGAQKTVLGAKGRLGIRVGRCPRCRGTMEPGGFDLIPELESEWLSARERRRTLASVGFQPGDVVVVRQGADEGYFQLGKD